MALQEEASKTGRETRRSADIVGGRELFRHCGSVGLDLVRTTFKGTQMLTGHENLMSPHGYERPTTGGDQGTVRYKDMGTWKLSSELTAAWTSNS